MTDASEESRFPEVMLGVSAAVWLAFGVWLFVDPAALSNVEVGAESATARAEIRAFYGGLELGVGTYLAWSRVTGAVRAGLACALAAVGTVGVCRVAGAAMEGFAVGRLIFAMAAVELSTAAATWAALRSLDRRDRARVRASAREG